MLSNVALIKSLEASLTTHSTQVCVSRRDSGKKYSLISPLEQIHFVKMTWDLTPLYLDQLKIGDKEIKELNWK